MSDIKPKKSVDVEGKQIPLSKIKTWTERYAKSKRCSVTPLNKPYSSDTFVQVDQLPTVVLSPYGIVVLTREINDGNTIVSVQIVAVWTSKAILHAASCDKKVTSDNIYIDKLSSVGTQQTLINIGTDALFTIQWQPIQRAHTPFYLNDEIVDVIKRIAPTHERLIRTNNGRIPTSVTTASKSHMYTLMSYDEKGMSCVMCKKKFHDFVEWSRHYGSSVDYILRKGKKEWERVTFTDGIITTNRIQTPKEVFDTMESSSERKHKLDRDDDVIPLCSTESDPPRKRITYDGVSVSPEENENTKEAVTTPIPEESSWGGESPEPVFATRACLTLATTST